MGDHQEQACPHCGSLLHVADMCSRRGVLSAARQHVRCTDHRVTDHRFRSVVRYANKLRPTLCGAAPSADDVSRKDALRLIGAESVRPDWTEQMCPVCRAALTAASA